MIVTSTRFTKQHAASRWRTRRGCAMATAKLEHSDLIQRQVGIVQRVFEHSEWQTVSVMLS